MAIIEAAYRLDSDDRDWLGEIARLGCDALGDPGMVSSGAIIRSHDRGFTHELRVVDPFDETFIRAVDSLEAMVPRRINAHKYRHTTCATASDLAKSSGLPTSVSRFLIGHKLGRWGGALDVIQVQGNVLNDVSVCFTALLREPQHVHPRVKHTWERVAMHMVAGLRLRASLRDGTASVLERAGLILEQSGAVAHASTHVAADHDLRESLRECARAVDHARGHLAKDAPEQAIELWNGLFAGRWSILETFDSDGRSYVIAVENEPEVAETRSLTRRERQVIELASQGHGDDLIGYTIGLSPPTVQTHLQRALLKTGIASRTVLVRAAATLRARLERDREDTTGTALHSHVEDGKRS